MANLDKRLLRNDSSAITSWAALLLACAYLVSPVLFHALRHFSEGGVDLLLAFNLATSLLWIALLHVLVRRPFLLHLCLLPFYLTTAIDLFLIGAFGARLSTGYVTIALTNFDDTGEMLLTYAEPLAFTGAILLLVYVGCLLGLRRLRYRRSPRTAVAIAAMLVAVYGVALIRDIEVGRQTPEEAMLDVAGKEQSSPFGALVQGVLAMRMQVRSVEFRLRRSSHSFAATRAPASGREIYVWVVGESSRPQDWSLFGYRRPTTPLLDAMPGIVTFPSMLTTAPHTSIAVPSMLSLRPITDWPGVLAEHSIVEAFKEVGFKTYWFSAQAADSWAGLIPQLAAEASERRYFDSGYDGALLPPLKAVLDDAGPGAKIFVVLHMKGSHFEYSRRYPREFARFGGGASRRQRLVDEYDNSVLYTDHVLAETIAAVAALKARSVVLFASDHGENLLDDDRQLLGHALGTTYDLHTAAFVWISDELAKSRPLQMQNLRAHAAARLSLSNLPHSILDLAGIETHELDRGESVFSEQFTSMPRSYIVRGELRTEKTDASDRVGRLP